MSKKNHPKIQQKRTDKKAAQHHLRKSASSADNPLFDRIVTILEEARGLVVRAVNTGMVTAYWLIGREIVEAVQGGEERAAYGKEVVENLSARLTKRYGKGFSVTNIWYFRQFYLAYADRARRFSTHRVENLRAAQNSTCQVGNWQ